MNSDDIWTVEEISIEVYKNTDVVCTRSSPENPESPALDFIPEIDLLRSRIEEQSILICMLKKRADEMFLQNQALQKINSDLEEQVVIYQKQLEDKGKQADTLDKNLTGLISTTKGIIYFMEEEEKQNYQLLLDNKRLKTENDSLFSQKLHDKEILVETLKKEIQLLREKCKKTENENREKSAGYEIKLREQIAQQQAEKALVLEQLSEAQQQHSEAVKLCKELKMKLEEAKEQHARREISMKEKITDITKEMDKLLATSLEKGNIIQEKQEKIEELENKWQEEKTARIKAQERFVLESEAVNRDTQVQSLKAALEESQTKWWKLNEEFKVFKEHSSALLTQERDLNKILRHLRS